MAEIVSPDFFTQSPLDCAYALVGCSFRHRGAGGIIVETEAYLEEGDEACHTFTRPSARLFMEKSKPGTGYVYLNYGMYWLVNVLVKGPKGNGFVLLRALDPKWGVEAMRRRRGRDRLSDLCSGPGKLSMALGMDSRHHGIILTRHFGLADEKLEVQVGHRIGISRATELPWRFMAAGNGHVSGNRALRALSS